MSNASKPQFVPPVFNWQSQIEQQMFEKDADGNDVPEPKTTPKPKDATSDDDEELGPAGKAALAAERKRANDLQKQIDKIEKDRKAKEDAELPELERLRKENAEKDTTLSTAQRELMQYRIGAKTKGLDPAMYSRIQGADEATMEADAKTLAGLAPAGKLPKADPSAGRKTDSSGLSTKDQFVDTIDGLFDNEQ